MRKLIATLMLVTLVAAACSGAPEAPAEHDEHDEGAEALIVQLGLEGYTFGDEGSEALIADAAWMCNSTTEYGTDYAGYFEAMVAQYAGDVEEAELVGTVLGAIYATDYCVYEEEREFFNELYAWVMDMDMDMDDHSGHGDEG